MSLAVVRSSERLFAADRRAHVRLLIAVSAFVPFFRQCSSNMKHEFDSPLRLYLRVNVSPQRVHWKRA